MIRKLPAETISAQDVSALIVEIRGLRQQFAQSAIKSRVQNSPGALPSLPPIIQELLGPTAITPTAEDFEKMIAELETRLKTAPRMTITLAGLASDAVKLPLVTWCRKEISADLLISFEYNSTLLGGMVLRYNSKIYDWSWRTQLIAAASTFPKVLSRV